MSYAKEVVVRLLGISARVAKVMTVGLLFCGTILIAEETQRVPDRLLVKAKHGVSERMVHALFAAHGATQRSIIRQIGVRVVHVPSARLDAVLKELKHDSRIEFVEPDYVLSPQIIPDDPYYPQQWHLPRIQAPQAWDLTTGSTNIIIAILDTGVDGSHPDLAGRLVPGWNFYDTNSNTSDLNGHGTAVAGAAIAAGNNGLGIAALAWDCMIMPIRVSDTNGLAMTSTFATALTWAADHGARVANISFTVSTSPTVTSAAQYFQSQGGVVTAASGNNGKAYTNADNIYMLTVSASDANDALATWSNTGSNIDLAAPGVGIYSTGLGGGYVSASGTSFSAPVVAGIAALVLSVNPALTGDEVQTILKQNADDLGTPGWDPSYGWGRANAYKAVLGAAATLGPPSASITSPGDNSTVSGMVSIDVNATAPAGITGVICYIDGALAGSNSAAPASFSWDTTQWPNGLHTLQAKASDSAGDYATSAAINVTVQNGDTSPPALTITGPASGSTVSNTVNVTVTATDNIGVTSIVWLLNGTPAGTNFTVPASFLWDTTGYTNGSCTVGARGFDAAGNMGSAAGVTVTVQNVVPDVTPPNVSIPLPLAGSTVSNTVNVSVSAADNVGVTRVEWYLNGTLAGASSNAATSFVWNTTTSANGTNTLQARAYDAAGNVGVSSAIVLSVQNALPDLTPPTVVITSPATGTVLLGKSVKVYVTASDNVGVTRVDLLVDGKNYATSTSATPVFSWSITKLSRGSHTLQSVAYDGAGNSTRSSVLTVTK